jgi:anti-sigma B factor antagonist
MSESKLTATVRRLSTSADVIDIQGEITSFTDNTLSEAMTRAIQENVHTIIINFTNMTYLNSIGIGLLVTLLVRARREGKTLAGYGLSEHYRKIFELTRLDQVVPIHSTQEIALASSEPYDLPEREY